jgi:hypothetical protein
MTGNKDINIKFIDGKDQRYSTCGDYWETNNSYEFRITKQDIPIKNLLILIHEMIEYTLCTDRGITEDQIMDFDLKWNKLNDEGHTISDEPGNALSCPYRAEHRIAENYERQLASHLNIDWEEYDKNLIL